MSHNEKEEKQSHAERLLAEVNSHHGIEKLLSIMRALRDPAGGCPWDKQQTFSSILPFTIEEVYEVAETIESDDLMSLKDELGDLLFQIVFYAQLGKEQKLFEFADIVSAISDKLIRRHPHVFAEVQISDESELNRAWEEKKQQERTEKLAAGESPSVLDDIPRALPELKRATKIQKRAAQVGFDWETPAQVWDKVKEEQHEVIEAAESGDQEHLEEELGDLMFALVNLTRHYRVDAETALRKANHKFTQRFKQVEKLADKSLANHTLDELEALWQKAKLAQE